MVLLYVFAHQKNKKWCGNKNLDICSRPCLSSLFIFEHVNKNKHYVLAFLSTETQKNPKVQNMFSSKDFYGNCKIN